MKIKINPKFIFDNYFMGSWKAGRMILEVRSIGHKWVYVKPTGRKQFSKITRAEWNQISSSKNFEKLA